MFYQQHISEIIYQNGIPGVWEVSGWRNKYHICPMMNCDLCDFSRDFLIGSSVVDVDVHPSSSQRCFSMIPLHSLCCVVLFMKNCRRTCSRMTFSLLFIWQFVHRAVIVSFHVSSSFLVTLRRLAVVVLWSVAIFLNRITRNDDLQILARDHWWKSVHAKAYCIFGIQQGHAK